MSIRRKILIVTTVPGTLNSILSGQPRWLNNTFEVGCVSSPGDQLAAVAEKEGVPVWGIPMYRGVSPLKDLLSIWRLWLLLRKIRPDIVHSYTPKAGLITMVAAFLAQVPCRIHTFTGLIFPTASGIRKKVLMLADRLICACATEVVPEGEGVKKDLVEYKITSKKLSVIGNGNIAGVDTDHFSSGCYFSSVVPENTGFVFCFVGRMNKDKGVNELVSAFLDLPVTASLFLVGRVDEVSPVDEKTLNLIKSARNIYMFGHQDDIRPFISRADVLVLPSYREGFPNVVLEAGAMRTPVIATDISGSNEIITSDWNGWLVSPNNVEELKNQMLAVMNYTPEHLKTMGSNARKRVVDRYERKAYLWKLLEFYNRH